MAVKANGKENKIVRGWSLSADNVRWVMKRAFSLSTAERRVSDSEFLDNLITAKREEQERAQRALNSVKGKK